MKKFLDKIFCYTKLSLIIPITVSLLMYLLFVFFGTLNNKVNLIIITPIVSIIGFVGVFFIIFIQIKNSMCPEWFLNLFELLVTIIIGIYGIIGVVSFVVSGFQNFNVGISLYPVIYSAVALAHSKRGRC